MSAGKLPALPQRPTFQDWWNSKYSPPVPSTLMGRNLKEAAEEAWDAQDARILELTNHNRLRVELYTGQIAELEREIREAQRLFTRYCQDTNENIDEWMMRTLERNAERENG